MVVVVELAPLPPLAAELCMAGAVVPALAALPLVAAGVVLAGVAGEPALLLTPLDCAGVLSELEQPARHNPPITKNFA